MLSLLHALSIRRKITPGQFFAMDTMEQKFMMASIVLELEADKRILDKMEAQNG